MVVVVAAVNPHMLVPVPMMIAVVVAFLRCYDAPGCEPRKQGHYDAADYDAFCVFHGVSL